MTDLSILRSGILLRQDRYRVVRIIGHGGMGAVYEVIDETLHSRLALKQFMRTEPALRLAFEREASLLANLRHTALPRVVDRFPEADSEFLVMDYIEGDTLLDLVNHTGALAHALVQNYAEQLFDVLDYLHTRMPIVIHRDIKPENIKISAAGQLYLLDFGIAKGSAGVYITTSADKSVPALSAGYAPIEQFLNVETGPQSDLFSAAATLYHALTGQRPVPANERQQAVSNNHPDPLVTPQQLNSGLPPVLCQMLTQALSLRAADRPESAAAMRMQLMAAGRSTAQPSGPAPTELGETIGPAPSAAVQAQNVRAVPSIVPEPDALPLPIRSPAGRAGQHSLQKRLVQLVRQVLDSYEGAWMVWCDPHGEWQPLIQRVAEDGRMGGFQLLTITDMIAGELGGLRARQEIQQLLDSNTSFVLLVRSAHQQLGWLWGQALLAERQYTTRLRDQLITWGWRPQRPDLPDDAIVRLAIQGLQQNPAEWGGSGLQPDMPLLLEVLAGGARPDSDQEYILQLTLELAGLPPYDAHDEERWRIRSLARLLFTEAHGLVPRLLSDQHEYLIAADLRPFAQRILQAWVENLRLSRRLPQYILEADRLLALPAQLQGLTLHNGPFLSRAAEHQIFSATCMRLTNRQGKELLSTLAALQPDLEAHVQGYWADPYQRLEPALVIPWRELQRLSQAAAQLLRAVPSVAWSSPAEAVQWYIDSGWQVDMTGDAFQRPVTSAIPELLTMIEPLRETFRARWEKLLIQWSDLWNESNCPLPALPTAGEWLQIFLDTRQPTAILVCDALRYDIAKRLEEQINTREGTQRASIAPARTALPTITALGMGMALPIPETQLQASYDGNTWHLIEQDSQIDLAQADGRRAWLRRSGLVADDGCITSVEALRGQIPAPSRTRKHILITDSVLDRLGHDDELEMLGSGLALDRYYDMIINLRTAGWRRIAIVTDHGFIHWSGNSEPRQTPIPGAIYRSRRALGFPPEAQLTQPHSYAPGGSWKIVAARGASCWSVYGGLGYFHGGASLQEWIIPCMAISWPGQAQPVDVRILPTPRILSAQPRVTLQIDRGSLFIEDALTRYVYVRIRERTSGSILFRSGDVELSPSQEDVAVSLRQTPGATADWEAPLFIEVLDLRSDEILAVTESTLRVRLDEW